MTVDKEPLFDLNDVLLGHSCRAVVPDIVAYLPVGDTNRLREEIGLNHLSRGLTSTTNPWDRSVVLEWFQPFGRPYHRQQGAPA